LSAQTNLQAVRAWILLSALLVGTGWILSALHELNRGGYLAVFVIATTVAVWRWRNIKSRFPEAIHRARHKLGHRFRRLAPLLFLALVLMSLLAGSLYLPGNSDALAYRIPRVLHWLGREQWHWIYTQDSRMNVVGCNFEWLSAPLILFTGTDQWIFLINVASYLMLPGLIFSVFTRLQVSPRTAWWWMWFLSSGWCFIFQAGSAANDSWAAVYALAMVDFALRARESKRVADLWLSMLAAALLTGVKQTNIPLALLWLIAAWPSARLLLARPGTTALVVAASLLVSAVPGTVLNIEHAGNWQGVASGVETSGWTAGSAFWKLVGNLFSIPQQNLLPPFFPLADVWNGTMQRFLQTPLGAHFAPFEKFGYLSWGVSEAQAGIGLGICLLTLVSLVGVRRFRPAAPGGETKPGSHFLRLIRVTPWILLLVFMAEICTYQNARLVAAYYPLLFPLLLAGPGHARLVRQPWWQWFGLLVMLLAAGMLVVSRMRPLFPAQTILVKLQAKYPHTKIFPELEAAYAAPRAILTAENYFKKDLPPEERVIGYATTNGDSEPGLWLPFGERRVERVLPDDTPEQLRRRGIHYVLVEDLALEADQMTIEQWMQRYDGSLVDQLALPLDRHRPPAHLYLVVMHSSPGL
jgi:hypothetical protein